jgi:hypothetical protein
MTNRKRYISRLAGATLSIWSASFCLHSLAAECAASLISSGASGHDIGPGTAALLGAAIGAIAGFGSAWVREWFESRRNLTRLAIELADRDFADKLKQAESRDESASLPPIGAFYHYYNNLLQAIATNKCTPDFIRHNSKAHGKVEEAFRDARHDFEVRLKRHVQPSEDHPPVA